MMKIVNDENTFIVPFNESDRMILISDYKYELLDCLYTYFVTKKKTKCIIYDDDNQIINTSDVNFIYLSKEVSYENNFSFKSKTIMNSEISEIINNNQDYFLSLEKVREDLLNINTDKGMYKLKKILSNGLNKMIEIELKDFNINVLLQFFAIDDSDLSKNEKQIILLNTILYTNRDKINIVYMDSDVDYTMSYWVENQKGVFFLIDNDSLFSVPNDYDLLILSNKNHLNSETESNSNIKILSYMNHQLVKANISLQNEKNVELYKNYNDNNSTFFIKNCF